MNSGDRWGSIWHTSETALARADGSWITEGTRAQQPEVRAEGRAAEYVCWGMGGSLKHFTLHCLQVHVESLPVCEKEEINSNGHLVINLWHNWRRQTRHCQEVTAVTIGSRLAISCQWTRRFTFRGLSDWIPARPASRWMIKWKWTVPATVDSWVMHWPSISPNWLPTAKRSGFLSSTFTIISCLKIFYLFGYCVSANFGKYCMRFK